MSDLLNQLIDGNDLSQGQAEQFFQQVINGQISPELLAAVLTALKIKGERAAEIAGAALAIRGSALAFPEQTYKVADCVGTGGDGANTINISTTTAILAAACGLKMAKHGNRSVSSLSGSADLLEALGVNISMSPLHASRCLSQANLCFLYARAYHPGFKYAAPVRKNLGVRTLFNILGPLLNPAKPKVMLLGVYTPELLEVMAKSLQLTGVERAWVVYGSGLDELAIHGTSEIIEINDGELTRKTLRPADFGLDSYPLDAIRGGSPDENAKICQAILAGKGQAAQNAAVIINCAALLYLHREQMSGQCDTLACAAQFASKVLASGKASENLAQLVALSNSDAPSNDQKSQNNNQAAN
jgi:anthranilate phosphoribosyltransferase